MFSPNLLGVISGLIAAVVWGSSDFSGGMAARKQNQFQVLVNTGIAGLVVILIALLFRKEGMLSTTSIFWSALAGFSGAFGIAALYRGLSLGNTASVAPAAAVISTGLPVVYSIITEGSPKVTQFIGFGLALVGIWLTTGSDTIKAGEKARESIILSFIAGIGFSGFFIMIAQVEPGKIFSPLLVSRIVSLSVAIVMVSLQRISFPSLTSNPLALLAGFLDAGGNIFYLIAKQYTRLDVAVVLSSLCPAITVVLAAMIMKEHITRQHWMGVLVCLSAVALIAV